MVSTSQRRRIIQKLLSALCHRNLYIHMYPDHPLPISHQPPPPSLLLKKFQPPSLKISLKALPPLTISPIRHCLPQHPAPIKVTRGLERALRSPALTQPSVDPWGLIETLSPLGFHENTLPGFSSYPTCCCFSGKEDIGTEIQKHEDGRKPFLTNQRQGVSQHWGRPSRTLTLLIPVTPEPQCRLTFWNKSSSALSLSIVSCSIKASSLACSSSAASFCLWQCSKIISSD